MSEQALTVEQPKSPMGRPSLYNPTTVGKVLGAFQLGLSVKTVCDIAGINHDTLYEWIKKYPDFAEKVSSARTYGTVLAANTIKDVLQDAQRDKKEKRYSEMSRISTARWYLERQEREAYASSGGVMGAKVETNDKGGTTTTLIYATDNQFNQLFDKIGTTSGVEDIDPAELLEVSEDSSQERNMAGGEDQERPAPVHTEELPHEHTEDEGMPQP